MDIALSACKTVLISISTWVGIYLVALPQINGIVAVALLAKTTKLAVFGGIE